MTGYKKKKTEKKREAEEKATPPFFSFFPLEGKKMMKKIWKQETATDNKRWLDFLFATNMQK